MNYANIFLKKKYYYFIYIYKSYYLYFMITNFISYENLLTSIFRMRLNFVSYNNIYKYDIKFYFGVT